MAPSSRRQGAKSRVTVATQSSSQDSGEGPLGNKEKSRLNEPNNGQVEPWRKWGPYVSERSWGGVREDILFYRLA